MKRRKEQSYIVKRPDPAEIFHNPTPDGIEQFLDQPFDLIVESLTGFLASPTKDWRGAAARIAQGALKGRLFQQVSVEIRDFQAKGKIPDDFAKRKLGYQSWVELMSIIDSECPDEERLDALKAMFYAINTANTSDGQAIVEYQLFNIAKVLTSGELLTLKATFAIFMKCYPYTTPMSQQPFVDWARAVCTELGHNVVSLVEHHERALMANQLITGRHPSGGGQGHIIFPEHARLTDLGIRFCENIAKYHIDRTE